MTHHSLLESLALLSQPLWFPVLFWLGDRFDDWMRSRP